MRLASTFLALTVLAMPATLLADAIPYPNPGTVAPTSTITATATGDVTGFYIQGGAGTGGALDHDAVGLFDLTQDTFSGYLFPNQTTAFGATADFGPVTAGDVLEFILDNSTTGEFLSSLPASSSDGLNHAYVTGFSGGTLCDEDLTCGTIPAGTYVGMEDLSLQDANHDFNYTDDSFVFTNVSEVTPGATPEPNSLLLLGTGVLATAGVIRRRRRRRSL